MFEDKIHHIEGGVVSGRRTFSNAVSHSCFELLRAKMMLLESQRKKVITYKVIEEKQHKVPWYNEYTRKIKGHKAQNTKKA